MHTVKGKERSKSKGRMRKNIAWKLTEGGTKQNRNEDNITKHTLVTVCLQEPVISQPGNKIWRPVRCNCK